MSKISELDPPPEPITGVEKIPVVQGSGTYGMPLGEFLNDTIAEVTAAAEAAAISVIASRPIVEPIAAEAMLLRDLGSGIPSMLSTGRDVVATTDADLNQFGFFFVNRFATLASEQTCYFRIIVPSSDKYWASGDHVAASVLIQTSDFAGLEFDSAARMQVYGQNRSNPSFLVPIGNFAATSNEVLRSDLRRYRFAGVIPAGFTDIDIIYLRVTAKAGRSAPIFVGGAMAALSENFPGDINWRNGPRLIAQAEKLQETTLVKTMLPNGNLPNGTTANVTLNAGSPTVAMITDTELNGFGCTHAVSLSNTAVLQNAYAQLFVDRAFWKSGDWVTYSMFVRSANFAGLDTSRLRALCIPQTGGGTQQIVAIPATSFEAIRSDLRRYYHTFQIPAGITNLRDIWFEIAGLAGRAQPIFATGFTAALSTSRPGGVDWSDWDPFSESALLARVGRLDAGGSQTEPGLLLASTYHCLRGRPLELRRDGLSEFREALQWDVSAVQLPVSGRAVSEPADPVLRLDGDRFSGAGFFMAKPRLQDVSPIRQRAVNFVSAQATGAGSPNVLVIGDSLFHQGTVTQMRALLEGMGLTPNFIGTRNDLGTGGGVGGTPAEARSSWDTANFTHARVAVNTNGTAQITPIRTGGGSGVTFTVTRAGGVITGITASGGSGYDNVPALPLVISGGAGIAAYATVAISGGVPGAVTIVNGGSGYTSDPTITMPITVAEYLALGQPTTETGARWFYNPFLRPSTGGDAAGIINNGYVFDPAFWQSRFSLATPDIVLIALGTNDMNKWGATVGLAQLQTNHALIYNQVRAAWPSARVGIVLDSQRSLAGHQLMLPAIRWLLSTYNGREAENIFVLPAFQAIDTKFAHPVSVSATDAVTGVQTANSTDDVHPNAIGRAQKAEMMAQFVMCRR